MVISRFEGHAILLESKQMQSDPRCMIFKLPEIFLHQASFIFLTVWGVAQPWKQGCAHHVLVP